jgi:hypothetical protein
MDRKPKREPYERPELMRHGSLDELTAGRINQKGTQGSTDKSSVPDQ